MARRRLAAILLCPLLGASGCADQQASTPDPGCATAAAIERALAGAPDAVALAGGGRLSGCVAGARSDGELQNAGLVFTAAADRLAARAQRGDPLAAVRLGYLVGATRKGAATSIGIQAELSRRIDRAAAYVGEGGAAVRAALDEGMRAGEDAG